jgi:hypothetical protein
MTTAGGMGAVPVPERAAEEALGGATTEGLGA